MKQIIRLQRIHPTSMTRKQIDYLITVHEKQRDYALKNLRTILTEREANGQETRWVKLYLVHKAMVDALNEEKPDDE